MEHRREIKDTRWKSVPEFGSWDKKGGASPNYSVVFSQARAIRKQLKDGRNITLGTEAEFNDHKFHNNNVPKVPNNNEPRFVNNIVDNNDPYHHDHRHHDHQYRYHDYQGRRYRRQYSQPNIHHHGNNQDDSLMKKRSFKSYVRCCMSPKM